MRLYRVRLIPESPWLTPWQSDTLAGLLCWTCARTQGARVLEEEIIQPGLDGEPPFVLSDAFPGEWLPIPTAVRTATWPPAERKPVKRSRWMERGMFARLQHGQRPRLHDLIQDGGVHEYVQLRNSIGRTSNTTAIGGGLYPTAETVLGADDRNRPFSHLTLYIRVRQQTRDLLAELLGDLATWGFGADRSSGKGQFRIGSDLEEVDDLDGVENPTGCVVLSTFQPSSRDPTDGSWDAFTKYGKLGPDFGFDNVFKRPLIMMRPGASFVPNVSRGWVGRAIPMAEMLSPDVVSELEARKANVVHWAFGLAVPVRALGSEP